MTVFGNVCREENILTKLNVPIAKTIAFVIKGFEDDVNKHRRNVKGIIDY